MVINTPKMQALEDALGMPLKQALKESYRKHHSWQRVTEDFKSRVDDKAEVNEALVYRAANRHQVIPQRMV